MSAKEVFDKAITLCEGETLLVPCHDQRQQESLRVGLAYQRKAFLASTSLFDVIIKKVTRDNKLFVSLTKVPRITEGYIISKDGSITTTQLVEDRLPAPPTKLPEEERIAKAMKEDGYSDEQIDEFLEEFRKASKEACRNE